MTDKEIFEKTKKVLYENMIKGHVDGGKTTFHYTKPSPVTYPFQFFWDTCFHVFILTALDEHKMAKEHLKSLFALQETNGFVGHMIYWDNILPGRWTDFFQSKPSLKRKLFQTHMSALLQPPMVAQALSKVYKASGDREFLEQMLPKLKNYYHWIAQNRDFEGDGLITIISPFESGLDWKPTFDPVLGFPEKKADWRLLLKGVWVDFRNFFHNYKLDTIYKKGYFLVKEVGFNTIYAQNLQVMAGLCEELNDPEAETFRKRADKTIQSMLKVMYDEKEAAFLDVYGKGNTKIRILTPTIFFPVIIEGVPEEISRKVVDTHFFNKEEFDVPFPIPSLARNHPAFDPTQSINIWRGPTWIFFNWFLHPFLMKKGYRKESKRLIDSIRQLIEKSGFREYYHPFTGEGYGAEDFTWAGLIVDMMQMEEDQKVRKS